ncbi:MAG: DUF5915 domain-containing protein, partial [Flavobacteriales bacterium]|nr:DUF5915 domain-containing protein [Flavobacteriales bacterium]
QGMNQQDIATLENEGHLSVNVVDKTFDISSEDVEISTQDVEGSVVATEDGITVALDIVIDDALRSEGIAREVVNRIQNMRKDLNFNVSDRIDVTIYAEEAVKCAISANNVYICSETLSYSLTFSNAVIEGEKAEFDDIKLIINIKKHA